MDEHKAQMTHLLFLSEMYALVKKAGDAEQAERIWEELAEGWEALFGQRPPRWWVEPLPEVEEGEGEGDDLAVSFAELAVGDVFYTARPRRQYYVKLAAFTTGGRRFNAEELESGRPVYWEDAPETPIFRDDGGHSEGSTGVE